MSLGKGWVSNFQGVRSLLEAGERQYEVSASGRDASAVPQLIRATVSLHLGRLQQDLCHYEMALQHYNCSLQESVMSLHEDPEGARELGRALLQHHSDSHGATQQPSLAISVHRQMAATILERRAQCELALEQNLRAVRDGLAAVESCPTSVSAHETLGQVRARLGDYAGATVNFSLALSLLSTLSQHDCDCRALLPQSSIPETLKPEWCERIEKSLRDVQMLNPSPLPRRASDPFGLDVLGQGFVMELDHGCESEVDCKGLESEEQNARSKWLQSKEVAVEREIGSLSTTNKGLSSLTNETRIEDGTRSELFRDTMGRASVLARCGDNQGAIQIYSAALQKLNLSVNDECRLLANRSLCRLRCEDVPAALTDAEACVSRLPTWPTAHMRTGQARAEMTDFKGAQISFNKAENLVPGNLEVSLFRMYCRRQMGCPVDSAVPTPDTPRTRDTISSSDSSSEDGDHQRWRSEVAFQHVKTDISVTFSSSFDAEETIMNQVVPEVSIAEVDQMVVIKEEREDVILTGTGDLTSCLAVERKKSSPRTSAHAEYAKDLIAKYAVISRDGGSLDNTIEKEGCFASRKATQTPSALTGLGRKPRRIRRTLASSGAIPGPVSRLKVDVHTGALTKKRIRSPPISIVGDESASAKKGASKLRREHSAGQGNIFGKMAHELVLRYGPPRLEAVTSLVGITLDLTDCAWDCATVQAFGFGDSSKPNLPRNNSAPV